MRQRNTFTLRAASFLLLATASAFAASGCRQILGVEDPVPCTSDDACNEEDQPCIAGECIDGACVYTVRAEGFVIDEGAAGDCISHVCDANAALITLVVAEDAPADDLAGDCVAPTCDAQGAVVDAPADDPPTTDDPGDCMKPACDAGTVTEVPSTADAPADDTLGDCQSPACDADGNITTAINTQDTPETDTAGDCHAPTCATGGGQEIDDTDAPNCDSCLDGVVVPWDQAGQVCYTFTTGTPGVGICESGNWLCDGGTNMRVCNGERGPGQEVCASGPPADEDCNGQTDEGGPGCACSTGMTQPCYNGPSGTGNVGICKVGTSTCTAGVFGACMGEVLPQSWDSCVTAPDDDCSGSGEMCTGAFVFAKSFGTATGDFGSKLLELSNGNLISTASFSGTITIGVPATSDGMTDVLLTRYDPAGNPIISNAFGGAAADTGGAIVKLDDGFAFGMTLGNGSSENFGMGSVLTAVGTDGAIAKYDNTFNLQWKVLLGGSANEYVTGLARMPDNGVVVIGHFTSPTINLGGGPLSNVGQQDMFVLRLAANGGYLWSKAFGSTVYDELTGVAVGPGGDIYIGGDSQGTIGFGGPTITNIGGYDAFLVKLDANGNHVWTRPVQSTLDDYSPIPAVQSDGTIWAAINYDAGVNVDGVAGNDVTPVGAGRDLALLHYAPGGAFLGAATFNGSGTTVGASPMIGPDDAIIVIGGFDGGLTIGANAMTSAGGSDAFIAKLSPTGTPLWATRYGGATGYDGFNRGYVDATGNIGVAGSFNGPVNFGGGNLTNAGQADIVIAKYRQ